MLDHASVTGGAAKVAFDSALGLKRAGHRPIVFAAAGPIDPRLTEEGVEVVCLGQHDILSDPSRLGAAARGLWNFEAARSLEALLASLPKGRSLVHVHGWAKGLSPSIAGPIAASGLPAVCTLHEYFLFCPNGGFFNYIHERGLPARADVGRCVTTNCNFALLSAEALALREAFGHEPRRAPAAGLFGFHCHFRSSGRDRSVRDCHKAARVHRIANPIEAKPVGSQIGTRERRFSVCRAHRQGKGPFAVR